VSGRPPERIVELTEHPPSFAIPAPPEVDGELSQPADSFRERRKTRVPIHDRATFALQNCRIAELQKIIVGRLEETEVLIAENPRRLEELKSRLQKVPKASKRLPPPSASIFFERRPSFPGILASLKPSILETFYP
jgi:hypothetical protein